MFQNGPGEIWDHFFYYKIKKVTIDGANNVTVTFLGTYQMRNY